MKKRTLLFLALVAISISAVAQIPSYLPATDLIGWYPFSGNAADSSGNAYDGSVNGAALTADRFGNPNQACNFNSSSIDIANDAAYHITEFTVSGWIKTSANEEWQTIFNYMANTAFVGYWLGTTSFIDTVVQPDSRAVLWIQGINGTPFLSLVGTSIINDGAWHNVIGTYDGITAKIYVDGVLEGQDVVELALDIPSEHLASIGNDSYGEAAFGDIDDVAVWGSVLSETEISSIYTGCSNPNSFNVGLSLPESEFCYSDTTEYQVLVSPTGGVVTINGAILAGGIIPSNYSPGTYSVVYSVTDSTGCTVSVSDIFNVSAPADLEILGLNTNYDLSSSPVTISVTPTGGSLIGPGVTGNQFNPALAGLGTHSVVYVYNGNGCLNAEGLCTTVDIGVGGDGSDLISNTEGIEVYPNPSSGLFTLDLADFSGIVSCIVYDANGKEVMSNSEVLGRGQNLIFLDLSELASGTYMIKIQTNTGNYTEVVSKK